MANVFSIFTETINEVVMIQKSMKWYQKINPLYHIKIFKMRKMLQQQVDHIKDIAISCVMLKDFQTTFILNSILLDNLSVNYIKVDYKETDKPIFYHMEFKSVHVDIILNNITITANGFPSYMCVDEISELYRKDERCNIIRECIAQYMQDYINKTKNKGPMAYTNH